MSKNRVKPPVIGGKGIKFKSPTAATAADSLALLKSTKAVNDYYNKNNYSRFEGSLGNKNVHEVNKSVRSNFEKENPRVQVKEKDGSTPFLKRRVDSSEYYKPVNSNQYSQREHEYQMLDLAAPAPLYDKRIQPHSQNTFINNNKKDSMYGDNVSLPMYDELAITPASMLTPEQIATRRAKYGNSGLPSTNVKPANNVVQQSVYTGSPAPPPQRPKINSIGSPATHGVEGLNPQLQVSQAGLKAPTPTGYQVTDSYGGSPFGSRVSQVNIPADKYWDHYKPNTASTTQTMTPYYGKAPTRTLAMGGSMKSELTEFNTGGRHEQNPLGGIPQGVGENGLMNTVEQGETKMNNFVYSDRIQVPSNIKDKGLPANLKGKTFAEASKIINDTFKDRNDPVSKSTKTKMLDALANTQEVLKAEHQQQADRINAALDANSEEVPDMMNGEVPAGMEEFMPQNQQMFGGGGGSGGGMGMGQIGGMLGNISGAIGGEGSFGKQMKENEQMGFHDSKLKTDQDAEQMLGTTKDTVASAFGPIGQFWRGVQKAGKSIGDKIGGEGGAAVSGIFSPEEATFSNFTNKDMNFGEKLAGTVPGLGAVMAHRSAKKRQEEFMQNQRKSEFFNSTVKPTMNDNNVKTFSKGGPLDHIPPVDSSLEGINNFSYSEDMDKLAPSADMYKQLYTSRPKVTAIEAQSKGIDFSPNTNIIQTAPSPYAEKRVADYSKKNKPEVDLGFMRYAPIATTMQQLARMPKPEVERLDRLNRQYERQFLDEAQLQNISREQAAGAMDSLNKSGLTNGQLLNAITATQLNATRATSEAYSKMREHNLNENRMRHQMALNNDQFNAQQSNLEKDINARNRAAYTNNRSKLLAQLGTDVGNVGKEEVYKKMAREATGYTWDGKYYTNGDVKLTPSQYEKHLEDSKRTNENSKGGKLKTLKFKM